jgi:hypothetical protein
MADPDCASAFDGVPAWRRTSGADRSKAGVVDRTSPGGRPLANGGADLPDRCRQLAVHECAVLLAAGSPALDEGAPGAALIRLTTNRLTASFCGAIVRGLIATRTRGWATMDRSATESQPSVGAGSTPSAETARVDRARQQRDLDVFVDRWLTRGETVACDSAEPATNLRERYLRAGTESWLCRSWCVRPHRRNRRRRSRDRLRPRVAWHRRYDRTRCAGCFSDDGRSLVARHERSDEEVIRSPSMEATLVKVDRPAVTRGARRRRG